VHYQYYLSEDLICLIHPARAFMIPDLKGALRARK
jgi:hypothetical protein